MLTLLQGRPADSAARQAAERRTYDFLDGLGVPYGRIDHGCTLTMGDCREIDRVLDATVCKNLLLSDRKREHFYLLMLPGEKALKTGPLAKQLGGIRLTFAQPRDLQTLLGLEPGALSVLGLLNDRAGRVTLLIDRAVLEGEFIGCHPCVNTVSLRLRTRDLLDTVLPALGHVPEIVTLP